MERLVKRLVLVKTGTGFPIRSGMTKTAKAGGDIAGGARKKLEKRLGHSIVYKTNYLLKKREIKQPSSTS